MGSCPDLIIMVEFGAGRVHLVPLDIADLDRPSALAGAGRGGEHELEDVLFPQAVDNDLQAPVSLEKQTFERVCRPCRTTMARLGAEGCRRAGKLGRGMVDEALGSLRASLAQSIAIAAARPRTVLLITAIQGIAHLGLKTFPDDHPGRQSNQLRAAQTV